MRPLAPLVFIAACALAAVPAYAKKAQPWPTLYVSAPLGEGWSISGEAVGRIDRDGTGPSQMEVRLELGHAITPKLVLWAGYVHVVSYPPLGRAGLEDQVVEQLNWKAGSIAGVTFSSRTRLEQRFQRGVSTTNWRVREQVKAAVPLGRHVTGIVWVEPFLALNQTSGARRRFDQLRSFAGISVPISPHVEIEAGYLNQFLPRASGNIHNDAVPVTLYVRF
ncbi:MAG: DUF2490 domain-containing protein [Sphingomonas sp.]